MANVELIDFTGKGRPDEQWHAADMLIFTKSTRLAMTPGLLDRVKQMTVHEKQAELDYMSKTIPSSWEFADVTFLVSGVSRAAAQQMTRTRTGSYAMQSLRVVDASEAEVVNPFTKSPWRREWDGMVNVARSQYAAMLADGVEPQDARGILPMNTATNIVCKYNLRAFVDLMIARSSIRVQGEYSDIADQMREAVLDAWPWAAPFFRPKQESAVEILEGVAEKVGLQVGKGAAWDIAKAIDLIKKG